MTGNLSTSITHHSCTSLNMASLTAASAFESGRLLGSSNLRLLDGPGTCFHDNTGQQETAAGSVSECVKLVIMSTECSLTHGVAYSGGGKRRERNHGSSDTECFLPLLTERCRGFTPTHTHTQKALLDLTIRQFVIVNLLIFSRLYEELPLKVSHSSRSNLW